LRKQLKHKLVYTGLDIIDRKWPKSLKGTNAGLLVHPASINRNLKHSIEICLKSRNFKVTTLFGPQHGIHGETQDNMIEWKGFIDKKTGLPVYSLYGDYRQPTPLMLSDIDVLIIDLQDIGSRYYTFIWTMDMCFHSCSHMNKSVVILDRPNPIGGHITEGNVLKSEYASFVGLKPLPVRHGMTIGEIANYLRNEFYPGLDLYIIPIQNWKRNIWFNETGLIWVLPSPNMPALDTALVYPGMCLLEGTNISEGRGTTKPFEIFGAPFIDPENLVGRLKELHLPGVVFRPMYFEPTFQKYAGKLCGGAQIHIMNREKFKPFKTGIAILRIIHDLYPDKFSWKLPPYEYEYEKMPIDIIAGTDNLRIKIEKGETIEKIEEWYSDECRDFNRKYRKKYLIYK